MRVAFAWMILGLASAALGAEPTIPATVPATLPTSAPTTAATLVPATIASTSPASAAPAAMAATAPTTTAPAATGPATTGPTTTTATATSGPTTTTAAATTGPATNVAATTGPTTTTSIATTGPTTSAVAATGPTTTAVAAVPPVSRLPALPSVRPSPPVPLVRSMSTDFSVLTRRSFFVKGQQRVHDGPVYVGAPSTTSAVATTEDTSSSPEHRIVFNGVTDADDELVAFLEDTSAGKISIVKVGDAIANGRITNITLDILEYQANGKTVEVQIGHNLEGQIGPPPTIEPSLATTPGPGEPATTAPSASGGSADDVAERMRKRRLQELGQ